MSDLQQIKDIQRVERLVEHMAKIAMCTYFEWPQFEADRAWGQQTPCNQYAWMKVARKLLEAQGLTDVEPVL